jgi:hypothetical protein
VTRRITSELGCVTPVIVVPGAWSPGELAYQAENVATMVAINASCNCLEDARTVFRRYKALARRRARISARAGGARADRRSGRSAHLTSGQAGRPYDAHGEMQWLGVIRRAGA